jgi:competence protein ComEC
LPLLWLSLAFLIGIVLANQSGWTLVAWLALAGLALLWLLLRRLPLRWPRLLPSLGPLPFTVPVPVPVLLFALALGAARYTLAQPHFDSGSLAYYNDREQTFILEGVLIQPPDERDTYTLLRIHAERLRPIDGPLFQPVSGVLQARVTTGGAWRYGDRVQVQGYLETPPVLEDFSYRDYLARQGIYSLMNQASARLLLHDQGNPLLAWVYALKTRALATIYRIFPDPEASLLAGILLGVETGIPEPVQQAFQATGTSHIIAISGFNITILAGLFSTLFVKLLGKRRRFLSAGLSVTAIGLYTILVGAEAAVVRAALMGTLALFARQVGRQQDGLNSLALVAALMALANPNLLWDVGFQLSFMATLGLVLYATPLSEAFVRLASRRLSVNAAQHLAGPVGEYVLLTFAAQITTLPVIAYHFNRISLVAFLVNPLILPAQPPVMIVGGLALLVSLVLQPLGQLLAYLAWPFVVFTIRVVEFFAPFPGAMLELGQVALPLILLYYAMLFAWTFARPTLRTRLAGLKPGMALLGLSLVVVLVWRSVLATPDGRLHLEMLDVGSGDALLIHTPTGRYLLIDGGPSARALSDALGRRLPLERRLDWLVVAGTSSEQIAALPDLLLRFNPDQALWAGAPLGTAAARTCKLPWARRPSPFIPPRLARCWTWGRAPAWKCWQPSGVERSCCWNGAISAPCCPLAWTKTCARPCWKSPGQCRSMPCCWRAAARPTSTRPNGCKPGSRRRCCSAWHRETAAPALRPRFWRPCRVTRCCERIKMGGCISARMESRCGWRWRGERRIHHLCLT